MSSSEQPPLDDRDLRILEKRRAQSDGFAWTVPGLFIAGQSFLFTIALRPETQPAARIVAALAGLVALIPCRHMMARQAFFFDLFEATIDRERRDRGMASLRPLDLMRRDIPGDSSFVTRHRPAGTGRWPRGIAMWVFALNLLILIDVLLLIYGVLEWSGADPHWLSPRRP